MLAARNWPPGPEPGALAGRESPGREVSPAVALRDMPPARSTTKRLVAAAGR